MKTFKKLLALMLAMTMIFALAACGSDDSGSSSTDEDSNDAIGADTAEGDPAGNDTADNADSGGDTENPYSAITYTPGETTEGAEGTIVVAMSADYAPYEFVDLEGNVVGFDVGLAKEIAKDLNMNLEIRNIPFDSCLIEMNQGKADMVISGLSPDPERDALFSDTYYTATQSAVIRTADAETYTDVASLAGKPVAAQTGSIQEGLVTDEFPESSLVSLQKIPDVVLNLKSNKVEAAVMEEPVAQGYVNQNDDLMIAFAVPYEESGSAVAVKKGNDELMTKINETIARVNSEGLMDEFVMLANQLSSEVS